MSKYGHGMAQCFVRFPIHVITPNGIKRATELWCQFCETVIMPRGKDITIETKNKIIQLYDFFDKDNRQGRRVSVKRVYDRVADALSINIKTVRQIIANHQKSSDIEATGQQTKFRMRLAYHLLWSIWVNQIANKVLWMKYEKS